MAILKSFSLFGIFLSSMLATTLLFGCQSPEQQAKERTETMKKFAVMVTKHLLDRDPESISESTTFLRGQELTDDCIAKLAKQEVIPNAGLDILKEKALAEEEKRRNVVEVLSVDPLIPIDKSTTPFKISGKNTIKIEGKPDKVIPFSLTMHCTLTPEMQGYPRCSDVIGLTHEDIYGQATEPKFKSTKTKKRRGH